MNYQQLCAVVQEQYTPLHPHLYELRDEFLSPSLVQAVRARTPEALARIYRQAHPGVFVFEMLRPAFCKDLLEEVACFENWSRSQELPILRPNTMNNYGTILDTMGFGPFLHRLMTEYVTPFAARAAACSAFATDSIHRTAADLVRYSPASAPTTSTWSATAPT